MECALTNGTIAVNQWGSTSDTVYISGGYGNSAISTNAPCYKLKENSMKLYKVFLVRIDTRKVIEVNVAARDQVDAFLKAFLAKQISEVDQYDKHAQFICDLTEEDD